jgi:amino acid permease
MRRATITTAVTTAIAILTGVSLAVDSDGSVFEIILQLAIPVIALIYKATDKDNNYVPDFLEQKKESEQPKEETP